MTADRTRFSAYRAVLRAPGVPLLALGAAVASLPIGLLGLALLLVMHDRGGAFTAGGLVVAGLGVGAVAGMLAQGRLIDRFGCRRALLPAAAVRLAAGAGFLAGDRLPLPVTVSLVVVVGVGEPQVSNALRAALPRLVDRELRPAAVAVSALMFELPVLLGPLLLTALLFFSTPATVVLVGLGASALGACLLAASSSAAQPHPKTVAARPSGRPGSVLGPLRIPAVRQLVAIITVQGLAVGVVQVASVARVAADGSTSGAGLLYAALTRQPHGHDHRRLTLETRHASRNSAAAPARVGRYHGDSQHHPDPAAARRVPTRVRALRRPAGAAMLRRPRNNLRYR